MICIWRSKPLAIAVLAIKRQPRSFQSISDRIDMKALVDDRSTMIWNECIARVARIAETGDPD